MFATRPPHLLPPPHPPLSGQGAQLDASLQVGAAGAIELTRGQTFKLRDASSLGRGTTLGKIDLDEGGDVREQLKATLRKNAVRVIDLFKVRARAHQRARGARSDERAKTRGLGARAGGPQRRSARLSPQEWDEDGDGTVDRKEFRKAMRLMGLEVPRKEVDGLFDEWDPVRPSTSSRPSPALCPRRRWVWTATAP